MYNLSRANYNNYSPPREMRPRINYTRSWAEGSPLTAAASLTLVLLSAGLV